uniref:Coiled-coil domain containing 116 n=1 Tax=Equus asinus TaxID=9793 RepID=A0A8C4MWK0_EQUAS|nr:coiled-coil domain-containing protein 116 isoform X2 [Equus asinus]XP_014723580.1 coiled-coil domain-containing protein 116 isoform X2 [Equus asinus]
MASCRHHSGYLADDEAGHTAYMARVQPPKKPLLPEMGQASKLGHMPHPPSMYGPSGSSGLRGHRRNLRGLQPFGSFLDFLVEGQVLDSLQTVVEEATERMATVKTEAGVPLVEVQDPIEVPRAGRRVRARPSLSTVHRHRARPSLCTGRPNNYPSCSSSVSDSHSSFTAGWLGSRCPDSDLGARGLGPLPPVRDKLLLEKNLKRLLRLEQRGKCLGQSSSQRNSLLWDSLGSQASSQWTPEQPLSWFSGLLGSSSGTPEASDLGPGEQELSFLKQEFNKEIKSLLSQPASLNLPGYCSLLEPHQTLGFLAEHHLFPALQNVVSQAVDKFSNARRHNGCPLFPTEWEFPGVRIPTTEPNSGPTSGSKLAIPTDQEEPCESLHTIPSSLKMVHRKSIKYGGRGKLKEGASPVSNAQVATRFSLKVTPTEEPKVPSPHPRQEVPDQDPEVQRPPVPASGPLCSSQRARPWRRLHLSLPAPGITVEVPSSQTHLTTGGTAPLASPCPLSSHHHPVFSPLASLSPEYRFLKKKPLPSISSKSTMSHLSSPWYEELVNYLMEQSVSLLVYKYKFEKNLTEQLGFISFPVTEVLMDLFLGFKKVKGSRIRLSSKIDWSCLLRKLEEAEWAQPVSWQTQHDASHLGSSQHSRESPSTLPQPATNMDQDEATEPGLHAELADPQLLTPEKDPTAEEEETASLLQAKLSTPSSVGMGSNPSEQAEDMEESRSSEDGEEDNHNFFGDQGEPWGPPKSQVEAKVSHSTEAGHGDPP